LASWRTHVLGDLLNMAATRRLRPRYVSATDTVVCDGPVQPVKPPQSVADRVR
jgi:hypothetical protein